MFRLTTRQKIYIAFTCVLAYVIAAVFWWTYALVNYDKSVKQMRMDVYSRDSFDMAGEFTHSILSMRYHNPNGLKFEHRNQYFTVDSTKLMEHLTTKFPNHYLQIIPNSEVLRGFRIVLKKDVYESENKKFISQRKQWLAEGFTLGSILIIVAVVLFVYLDRLFLIKQQQNNFILAVTHELKTPVAASKLAIQTAKKALESKPELMPKLLTTADDNITRLGKLMENVLTTTRIQSNKKLQKVKLSLSTILHLVMEELQPSFPETGTIQLQTNNLDAEILGNADSLKIAFSNLIGNAIKYSNPNEVNVQIKFSLESNFLVISVSDFGKGIPEKERKKIFQKFYRIGDERVRESSGTGLGLYLAKKIFRQHNAIISCLPNQPRGTIFKIAFKLSN